MNRTAPDRRILRILPGLIVSGAAILALVWVVDWRGTAEAWGRAQMWVLLPAFALTLAAMWARAAGWRFLMGNPVPLRRCFWVLNISYLLNSILPFRLGDVARAYLIGRPKDSEPAAVTSAAALSAVVLERMFDVVFTFVLVLSIFPMIAGGEWGGRVLLSTFGIAMTGFAVLLLVGTSGRRILHAAERIAGRIAFLRPLLKPLEYFLDGLRRIRDLRRSLPGFALIGTAMVVWAVEYWIVLTGFFPGAPLYWGLLSLIGGLIGVMLPSSPSSLGVFEAAVVLVLTMSGLEREPVVAYAIAIHTFNIVLLSSLGALGLLIERQSLGSILAAARTAQPASGAPGGTSTEKR